MRAWLCLICVCVAVACSGAEEARNSSERVCEPSITVTRGQRAACKGDLIFEDTFDFLDTSKWKHEITMAGGGNFEFQIYWEDPKNSYTQDGNLVIMPGKLSDVYGEDFLSSGTIDLGSRCTVTWNNGCVRTGDPTNILNPMTSARLDSSKSFSFKYGTWEIRAKMPAGDWLWPALFMMPTYSVYGDWPLSGEVDLVESRGNRDLTVEAENYHIGVGQALQTLHWGMDRGSDGAPRTAWQLNVDKNNGFDKDFHTYRMEWVPDHIIFWIDGVEMGRVEPPAGGFWELGQYEGTGWQNPWTQGTKMAPFDEEFFMILCLAVGGVTLFPDHANNPGGKPWTNGSPTMFKEFWDGRSQWEPTWWDDGSTALRIDYVRVWSM